MSDTFDPTTLEIYRALYTSVAEEMGIALRRTAFSPNIKERRDYSCAVFDPKGRVIAQGDHMPVHLGSMPMAVAAALRKVELGPGDVVALNDPFAGGTHLPDVTLVMGVFGATRGYGGNGETGDGGNGETGGRGDRHTSVRVTASPHLRISPSPRLPVSVSPSPRVSPSPSPRVSPSTRHRVPPSPRPLVPASKTPLFYVANRAHHADIGGATPGSMGLSTDVYGEGVRIPPVRIMRGGELDEEMMRLILANVRGHEERRGDFRAQIGALRTGSSRLLEIVERRGAKEATEYAGHLIEYSARLMRHAIAAIPDGDYRAEDVLDDDGITKNEVPIRVNITIKGQRARIDFSGSAPQVAGPINAVEAITVSAVSYVFRCLLAGDVPASAGLMEPIEVIAPHGTVVNARHPASVAGGNVETSQRIVDVVFKALARALPDRMPAASQGTMNNLTIGGVDTRTALEFSYYETIAGGMGARPHLDGISAVHTHMTNSFNTPAEALEYSYPLRVREYRIRKGSGGKGMQKGGDGVIREIETLVPARMSLLADRREHRPYGLQGGEPGKPGRNSIIRDGRARAIASKGSWELKAGDRVRIETPGGGGFGTLEGAK
ncbi:MAG TPA: hydantoinase B/oxoprolinase family protein [Pyrinomonadaceae bacterium]|nr:hydantoinase B/oxoprolinase family protein [Pyrinomonadaceae bacterium]